MGNQQESLNIKDLIPVPEISGYFVSEEGEIFSTRRYPEPKKLTLGNHFGRSKSLYLRVKIDGKSMLAHRVVASTLMKRQLISGEVVNHINGNTSDNKRSNLEVVSHRENVNHAVHAKLYCHGGDWYKARGMQEC